MLLIGRATQPEPDEGRKALGVWGTVVGTVPAAAVRVFATYEALWGLDPSKHRDVFSALKIFRANRAKIEAAAGRKFDVGDIEDDRYERRPLVMIRDVDL
jgi:hypothetical protein